MQRFIKYLRNFGRAEDGSTTVEWVIIFPTIFFTVLAAIESGVMMSRYMLLDRAVDITAREIRLGLIDDPSQTTIRAAICEHARVSGCATDLIIDLQPAETVSANFPDDAADCRDRSVTPDPTLEPVIDGGDRDQIMYMRVCALADPFMPGVGLGLLLPKDANGAHRMVTYTAFMNEPR